MVPRDPSSCRGWIAFRVGPHFSRPSARRGLRRQERDALSGACLSPQCCNAVRSSEGATAQGHGGAVARRLSYDRTQGRMGARVMASGMPGASRRAVLGGATYSVVKVCVRLRGAVRPGSVTISATSLARVQSAPCPFGLEWITCWTRLKLALGWSIAQEFWGVSRKGWLSREDLRQSSGERKRNSIDDNEKAL